MRRKLKQKGDWYVRIDRPIQDKFNVLLGCNYTEGYYGACRNPEMTDCATYAYCEFQIGILFFTFVLGKEYQVSEQYDVYAP